MKNQIRIAILLMLAVFLPIQAVTAASDINQQRKLYQQAKKALQTHQLTQFRQLQDQLEGYPLQEYLDYLYLQHRINDTEAATSNAFCKLVKTAFSRRACAAPGWTNWQTINNGISIWSFIKRLSRQHVNVIMPGH